MYVYHKVADHQSNNVKEAGSHMISSNLTVPVATIAELNLEEGDALTLECGVREVNVLAQGSSWNPVVIGTISDGELYHKASCKMAQAKIFAINGDIVTVEFKYR